MKDFAKSILCNTKTEVAKVGNITPNYRYKGFLITNPEGREFVVFLQDGIHVGYRGTTSKAMAEDWCDWHDPKTGKPVAEFRNSKTGNTDVVKVSNSRVGNNGSFSPAVSKGNAAIAKIKQELSKPKPDIREYFSIAREAKTYINKCRDEIHQEYQRQNNELLKMIDDINAMEDKFYK